ncbi:MAG: AAA family ATPase [Chloroflexi bacterium]|nr:AAA family ATPase [Chloroflexota bacterium]
MTNSFGGQLRSARQRAGFDSYRKFAVYLTERDHDIADETLGNYERDARKPHRDDLLPLLSALAIRNGFSHLADVNQLLESGDYDPLTADEVQTHFPDLPADRPLPHVPLKPYHEIFGRDAIVQTVGDQLLARNAPRLMVISGLGGIGKTAIAHAVLRRVIAQNRFESVLWQSMKSEEFISTSISRRQAVTSFSEALLGYGRQIGLPEAALQSNQLAEALKQQLQTGAYLIVLDNLETLPALEYVTRELHAMIGDTSQSRVLITSRKRIVDEPYLVDYQVRGLSEQATFDLLRDEAQQRGATSLLQADTALMQRIFAVTGGMPLAIKLIVSQYLLGISLDEELDRLMRAVDEEQLYHFIYHDLWVKLPLPAQKLLVGAAGTASAMLRSMLIEASELTPEAFTAAVPELVRTSLLEVRHHPIAERQRYEIHPITRWFINIVLQGLWKRGDPPSAV